MISTRRLALALSLLLVFAAASPAQFRVKTKKGKPTELKPVTAKFEGEVLFMTRVAITVRGRENTNLVRTFTYDHKLAEEMTKFLDKNEPYQFGDRIEIEFVEGTDQALKIKGKRGQGRS